MDEFYADNVVMSENDAEPTVGLAANLEREQAFVNNTQWHGLELKDVVVDGALWDYRDLIEPKADGTNSYSVSLSENGALTVVVLAVTAGVMTPSIRIGTRVALGLRSFVTKTR